MAARTGSLFQDQNLNGLINGAATVSGKADFTGQRKARAGGRKPLGDLSNAGKPINQAGGKKALNYSLNSGKPSVSQASKQLKSKNLTITMNDEAVDAKVKNLESNRRTVSKCSEKSSHTGSRKALSDISNSAKPHVPETKNKNSLKPSALTEEPLHPSAIAEEKFLHNHQECIKSQREAVNVHQFFKTVGLENDSDDRMAISFELPAISKLKSESGNLELDEVPEQLPEVQSIWKEQILSAQRGSPLHCKTPKLSSCYPTWEDFTVNFKLIETPELSKK